MGGLRHKIGLEQGLETYWKPYLQLGTKILMGCCKPAQRVASFVEN